jgi:site-specific DNA recombinase
MIKDLSNVRRCAVYTRKSSEEGLAQDFNSLDAQREACEAYIASQKHEGWKLIRTHYDDGGWSGGTMDRPALIQLLADIGAGKVDTVVVYKVDRLTRSLADFAKIVEIFDANGVAFVSVTQQFNTTTSMGRLTLNMLLSFAQFEREVTGERIRDKIAASKQKGMWMGGHVPLGYEADGRTLRINSQEAETVRKVFDLYLELGNVRQVKDRADDLGLITKARKSANGEALGGRPLSRGYIYKLLANPLYVGQIAHKGTSHPGQHPPIIPTETWSTVQERLKEHTRGAQRTSRKTEPSPLAGKVFDETGQPLTPTHAVKSGRRYRYYVSRQLVLGALDSGATKFKGWRIPARELERIVADAIARLFADPSALAVALRQAQVPASRVAELIEAATRWDRSALQLVRKVNLQSDSMGLSLGLTPITGGDDITIDFTEPLSIKRRGVEMRLVLPGARNATRTGNSDPALIKAIARAHRWLDDLKVGRAESLTAIAAAEGLTQRYVAQLLPLAFLAPEIVEAIVAGDHPADLTLQRLIKQGNLPLAWSEQKAKLGFN